MTLALAALGGVLWMLRPSPVPVDVGRVRRGSMSVTLDAEGRTRVHPRYVVAAPVAGRLASLALDEGDPVRQGETVALLTPQPLDRRGRLQAEAELRAAEARLSETDAQLSQARAAHELAARSLARAENLAAAGQLAQDALDVARTAARTALQSVGAARSRREAARCTAEGARAGLIESGTGATIALCAPADGRVLRLREDSERVVPAGTPILEVGDPTRLEVVMDVLSTDAVAIPPGAAIRLDAGSGRTLEARVRMVEPAAFTKVSPLGVEEQRVNVIGELPGPVLGLGDGFRVDASIVLWSAEAVLKAPAGAVFRSGDRWAVFVVEGGRARRREVGVGHRNADDMEIGSGLSEGATLILYPGQDISDGVRVTIP